MTTTEAAIPDSYADYLRDRLKKHAITRGALARATGIDRSQISRWLNQGVSPTWKTVVRLETGIESILNGRKSLGGEQPKSDRERLPDIDGDLLREYVDEFRNLIALHDKTAVRWRYFQTEWLWLFLRGMLAGERVSDVKQRRLAELKKSSESRDQEEAEELGLSLHNDPTLRLVYLVKAIMWGGPADGESRLVAAQLPDELIVSTTDDNGSVATSNYHRDGDQISRIVPYPDISPSETDWQHLRNAFSGVTPTRYVWSGGGDA